MSAGVGAPASAPDVPARRAAALGGPVLAALGLWAATRVAVFLSSTAGTWTLTERAAGAVATPEQRWRRWDVDLFRKVAEHGYQGYPTAYPDRGIEGFFPGFPLVLKAAHVLVPSWTYAGMLVSAVAGAVAVVALARLAELEGVRGDRAVLYLLLSPYAVFLAAAYSEALFLAFALPAWLAARQGRWPAAALLAALATTVRITGVFLAVALLVEHLVQRRGRLGRESVLLLLPGVALAGYWGYLYALTGDPLRWFSAQEQGWQRRLTAPWTALGNTLQYASSPRVRADYAWAFTAEIVAVGIGLVLVLLLLRSRRWGEAVYVGLGVGALGTSTLFLSVNRASLLWFPLWLLLARATQARPWLHVAYLAVAAPLSLVVVLTFTSGHWVG